MSHFGIKDALKAGIRFNALKTYWIGFSHPTSHAQWRALGQYFSPEGSGRRGDDDDWVEGVISDYVGDEIAQWKGDVGPCWDGLRLRLKGRGVKPEEVQDDVDTWR